MANFLFIYRGGNEVESKYTPAEIQAFMQKWMDWIGEGFAKGWMVDPGDALKPGGAVVNAKKVVSDGPFPESKEVVGGYSVIKTGSLKEAGEIAKGCPALLSGGAVEIREMAGLAPPK
jgi:hypothetical protein